MASCNRKATDPSNCTRMKRHFPTIILALVAVIFAAGLLQLFRLRFAEGDVYPEYSSLRADPLGTMAFCESLEKIPGLSVRRDFSAENRLPEGRETTYLHLAARTFDWRSLPEDVVREIEGFVARGGRLVITFFPETAKPFGFFFPGQIGSPGPARKTTKTGKKAQPAKADKKKKKPADEVEGMLRRTSLKE